MEDKLGLSLPVLERGEVIGAIWGEEDAFWRFWRSPRRVRLVGRLGPGERQAFDAAQRCGFLLQGLGGHELAGAWYLYCRAAGIPAIRVRVGPRWARIRVDVDIAAQPVGEFTLALLGRILAEASKGKTSISPVMIETRRIPAAVAVHVARSLALTLGTWRARRIS